MRNPMGNDISITKRTTIDVLKQSVWGMRHRSLVMAEELIGSLVSQFEELENDGAEFECLELTATFKTKSGGNR